MINVKEIRLILGSFVESIEDSRLLELAALESQIIPALYADNPFLVSYKVASRLLFNLEVHPSGSTSIKKKQSGQEVLEYSEIKTEGDIERNRYEILYHQTLAKLQNISYHTSGNIIQSE